MFYHQDEVGLEEESYEVCYNNACYEIGCDRLDVAQEKLKKAEGEINFYFIFNIAIQLFGGI